MPTYGIHDTTVKLYVWDPHQPAEQVGRTTPIDPACGRAGEPLKEEYFNGQEGVDFLGYDIPFFLVNAGRELFFETPQASSAITDVELVQGEEVQSHADESDDDAGSFLSTISSSMLADLSPQRFEESTTQNNAFETKKKRRGWGIIKPKSNARDIIRKPITYAIPMKIQLELTKKSFRALYTNDFQDICANIFINGDFVHSRVLRSNTARCFTADQKDQAFGGRRIDTYLEIPWVILPMAQKDTPSDQAHASSSFKDRWDQVNQLLLKEADLWGRTGKYDMFRAPVGEYLAELSKKPIPESINGKERTACKAGIIDVVISFGKSITISNWSNLTRPHRKLPKDVCGKERKLYVVPEELNPQHKAQIIADFEREEEVRAASSSTKRKSQAQNAKDGYYFNKVTTEKIPLNSSTNESAYTAPLSAGEPTQIQDEPSSSQPLALVVKSSRMKRGGSLPEVYSSMAQQRPRTDSIAMPTAPTLEQPRHPNKPKVTPEKSFKGPASSNKPQKQNHWETIPFDAEKSPSDSNRSKRSRSIPASSPDNLLGQELVDNYLTLRNRQLGALPSSPLGRPPRSSVHEDGIAFTPGVSSEMDNSPCKPATGFGKQHQSSSRLRKNGDASKEAGLGLDGAGDARKRKSDMSVASESTPTRSSKRKRPSSGSSNAPLGAGENYSMQPAKITKRTSMNSKDNEGSGDKVAQVKQGPSLHTMAMNDFHSENLIDAQNAQEQFVTSRPQEQINKKQRRHSRAMSARELSSVLTPHKPAMGVNTSFGASFAQASSTRSTRNPTTRQEKVANETKAESSQAKSLKVTATYKMPMLFMKGVESLTQETMTRGLAKNTIANSTNTTSEPASHADDSEKAESGTIKGRSARVKQPEKNVSKMVKRKQKDAEALITPANIAKESPNTQEQQMMTMRPNTKVQSAPQNGDEYVEKAEVSSSMNTKPKIDPGIASADSSRRYQKSSREAKTLTPSSVNLATMEHIKTPNTLLHTVSSSATMKETPGSTIFFREVPTPTMSFPVTQGGVEPPKPATREPLFPPLNTVSTPCSTSGPAATATATTTGSVNSTVKEQHPLNLSVSADLAWKPNSICADSVLSYATEKMATNWSGKEYVLQSGCVYRGTKAEREAVFRASGILMGVRFVLGVSQDQGGDVVA